MTPIQLAAENIKGIRDQYPKLTDRFVLGDLVQRCDLGAEWVEGRNNYVWWYLIGLYFRPARILEIGTRFGYSLKALISASPRLPEDYSITVFDNESDSDKNPLTVFELYFKHTLGIHDLRIHRDDTQKLSKLPVDTPMDMVVVDANHTAEGAYHDCGLAFETLRPGGILVVDDTNPGDVREGCERFCKERSLPWAFLTSLRGIHLVQKPFG